MINLPGQMFIHGNYWYAWQVTQSCRILYSACVRSGFISYMLSNHACAISVLLYAHNHSYQLFIVSFTLSQLDWLQL